MKQSKLSLLENKYYYAISRYFWHIVIALGILGIAAGVFTYLWTLVPPSKKTVTKAAIPNKPAYPDVKNVELKEILALLPKKKTKPVEQPMEVEPGDDSSIYEEENDVAVIDSVALANFNKEMGRTKTLIPEGLHPDFWRDKYQDYFNSECDKKMYRKNHNPLLKHSRLVRPGFKQKFIDYTNNRQQLTDYNDKTAFLAALNDILEKFNEKNRVDFITRIGLILPVHKIGINETKRRLASIGTIIDKIPVDKQISTYNSMWKFVKRNPNDGKQVVEYIGNNLEKVPHNAKIETINRMIYEYTRYYNNRLNGFREATGHFLSYANKIDPDNVVTALGIYYKEYRKNNNKRANEVARIDRDYKNTIYQINKTYSEEIKRADYEYRRKKSNKRNMREWSYKGIFSGFISILIISLFLLILSMIRNINRLTEAMYENNKVFQHQIIGIHKKDEEPKEIDEE